MSVFLSLHWAGRENPPQSLVEGLEVLIQVTVKMLCKRVSRRTLGCKSTIKRAKTTWNRWCGDDDEDDGDDDEDDVMMMKMMWWWWWWRWIFPLSTSCLFWNCGSSCSERLLTTERRAAVSFSVLCCRNNRAFVSSARSVCGSSECSSHFSLQRFVIWWQCEARSHVAAENTQMFSHCVLTSLLYFIGAKVSVLIKM